MPVKSNNLLPFENKVLSGLCSCGIDFDSVSPKNPLGAAVSGGADSVSLLLSLRAIFGSECLRVITVEHGIRSASESGGDADFVQTLCASLGVPCRLVKIPEGKIIELAKKDKKSVEEVARNFRYEAFESFIQEEKLLSLCLAHNQGDQLETVLMRFLQGSAGEGMGGIARVRGKFSRPLLDVSRSEIEAYLHEKKQDWRTDSTNADTKYLRNKVRNVLIPLLNEKFHGWQKAVLSGAKKASSDEDFLKKAASDFSCEVKEHGCELDFERFCSLHASVKRRVFFSALNSSGFGGRFPFKLFEEIASWNVDSEREINFETVRVSVKRSSSGRKLLVIEKASRNDSDSFEDSIEGGFAFLLKKPGDSFEIEKLFVQAEENFELNENTSSVLSFSSGEKILVPVRLPALVRSYLPGDKIRMADGNFKSLSELFSDWKIPEALRGHLPVVEELSSVSENSIRAVVASPFGFKNWIVAFRNL